MRINHVYNNGKVEYQVMHIYNTVEHNDTIYIESEEYKFHEVNEIEYDIDFERYPDDIDYAPYYYN